MQEKEEGKEKEEAKGKPEEAKQKDGEDDGNNEGDGDDDDDDNNDDDDESVKSVHEQAASTNVKTTQHEMGGKKSGMKLMCGNIILVPITEFIDSFVILVIIFE